MRANDHIIFIDSKGVSNNALVKSYREHRGADNKLVHDQPLVTLTYNLPTGEPKEVIDAKHISHPERQEPNQDLPTYGIHAWKFENEEHLEVPPDHPLHDHPYKPQEFDAAGNPVPKRRPIYEKHIQWHKAAKVGGDTSRIQSVSADHSVATIGPITANVSPADLEAAAGSGSERYGASRPDVFVEVGHPKHPDTVAFDFKCDSCGKSVKRVASHQGGSQWDAYLDDGNPVVQWKQHICTQDDIDAYRESLKPKPPAPVELSPSERLAAGEELAKKPEPAIDVIAELDKAGPAPQESQPPAQGDEQK